jgi:protocatechuate 3,4-dioxygenase beta subunit
MRALRRCLATTAVATLLSAAGAAGPGQVRDAPVRQTPSAAGLIAGIVLTDETPPRPLRRAIVTLTGAEVRGPLQTLADDSGRFAFANLPAGRFTLTAEKPGFVKSYFGGKRPGRAPGMPIALAEGQQISDVSIKLLRGAVIAGTVRDEQGVPVASAQVQAVAVTFVNGERKLGDTEVRIPSATTDERGEYRLYGLPPGEYTATVAGGGGLGGETRQTTQAEIDLAMRELQGLAPATAGPQPAFTAAPTVARALTYPPGVADPAAAQTMTVKAGEERTGVDIVSPLVRVARIEGIALGPSGQPLPNMLVGIANLTRGSLGWSPGAVRPGPDGRFTMQGFTPGRYLFFGRGTDTSGTNAPMPYWTATEVVVAGDNLSGVVLQFEPGVTVSGRLVFDGAIPPPLRVDVRVALTALPAVPGSVVNVPVAVPAADGTFVFQNVAPGRFRLSASGTGSWALRSAIAGDHDTLDTGLEVLRGDGITGITLAFTDRPTEVSGTLFDQLGRPTPEYSVVVFPTDRALWTSPRRTSGAVKLGSDGRFKVTGLPAGEYFLSALADVDPRQLGDPSFLELLAGSAVKITLGEGERKTQDLRIGR